jgi:hypothetical protein
MSAAKLASGIREGNNDPSPITRVVALDWSDGPTDGVLQVGDGATYRFQMIDSRSGAPDESDVRVYGLHPLPADALSRLTDALADTHQPTWPVFWPIWKFPSEDVQRQVEREVEAVLAQAGPLEWVLVGDIGIGPIRALPVELARAS